MLKVVLDTNVLISACEDSLSSAQQIIDLIYSGEVQCFTSKPILDEYKTLLSRLRDPEETSRWTKVFDSLIIVRVNKHESTVTEDPEDDKFVDCARATEADYLITNDNHLLSLEHVEGTRIVTPKQFVNIHAAHQDPEGKQEWSEWTKMILGE